MTHAAYALLLFERQKRDRVRTLKARIRARLAQGRPDAVSPETLLGAPNLSRIMGYHKHYLNDLICSCVPDNGFAQDAIDHAITTGQVQLSGTYNMETDTVLIMNQYDRIVEAYHAFRQAEQQEEAA